MKWLALLAAALFVALPGCSNKPVPGVTHDDTVCVNGQVKPCDLANATSPKVDARKTLDDLKAFSQAYPYRQAGNPIQAMARDDLAARFKADGLDVVRQSFPSHGTATTGGPAPTYNGENILGFKWGSDRSSWIVVGAHYDVTEGAVYGTYDDGSGTADVFELAAAFAHVNTTRTIVFAEFDQEELGLVGSNAFRVAAENGTLPYNGTLDGMIDLDMIGITWPHPAHIVVWENSATLTAKVVELAKAVGVPTDHVEFRKPLGGSSDGATFIRAGVATAYFWSDWDNFTLPDGSQAPHTPVPYVGPYPWWHKLDTYDTMVQAAGDETTLQAGFQTTLDIVSPLLAFMASPHFDPDPESA